MTRTGKPMGEGRPVNRAVSLLLKVVTFLSAVIGTALSALAAGRSFMGGSFVFMYFTIQSNLAIALVCAVGAVLLLRSKPVPRAWAVIKYVMTVAITLTGVVFCFVLAPTLGRAAWNLQNILTHVVVPIAAVADFFVTAVYGGVGKRCVLFVTLPPLAYAIYAGVGYVRGWQFSPGVNYPYFFLNWGSPAGAFGFSRELPFMGCVWWILALLLFLLLIGALYLWLAKAIRRRALSKGWDGKDKQR